ncbi:MAG: nucleotidyltransferase family protein [Bacteroidota bacterium]
MDNSLDRSKIVALILAAGASTRMPEQCKQLLPWKETTLLGNAIKEAHKTTRSVYVVLGANAQKIKATIPSDTQILVNQNWQRGIGSSIAFGASHIMQNNTHISGLLIMLADQPLIDAEYLKTIVTDFERAKARIVATAYGKKSGVPAIFHHLLLQELSQLENDFGAKNIIKDHQQQTLIISANGKEIDIDTPKTYYELLQHYPIVHKKN